MQNPRASFCMLRRTQRCSGTLLMRMAHCARFPLALWPHRITLLQCHFPLTSNSPQLRNLALPERMTVRWNVFDRGWLGSMCGGEVLGVAEEGTAVYFRTHL